MRYLNLYEVEELVCNHFNIVPKLMFAKSRKSECLEARRVFHYFSIIHTKKSSNKIGAYKFNKWDHATVLNSKKTVENLCFSDKKFREEIETLNELMKDQRSNPEQNKTPSENVFIMVKKTVIEEVRGCSNQNDLNKVLTSNISFQND